MPRSISSISAFDPDDMTPQVFKNVYYKMTYPIYKEPLHREYYHYCEQGIRMFLIEKLGTCTNCKTHIASYDKLDLIVSLKELT